ncbi:immunoglobulin-like domain-containing protein, partial [Bacteroides ovatus]
SIDSLNSYKMDISHFINSIEPGETIVEEKQMQGKEFITRENEHIKVCFLLKAPCSKDGFLKTEITNNTNDTITYISNTFLRYRESNNSWIPLVYPDNYVKNDLGYLIPPHESVKIRFFLPSQEEYPKGKYKLQLLFRNASKSIDYYIDKIFVSTKSN